MKRLLRPLLALAIAGIACASLPVDPPPHPVVTSIVQRFDSVTLMLRIDPPPEYEVWRRDVEACSGLRSDTDDTFWIVPRRHLSEDSITGYSILAIHIADSHKIIFGLGWEMDANTVRHEILHHLLSIANDQIDHDPKYYKQRCAGLVE